MKAKQYLTEQDMLQKLDIPDWRHMTKDKVMMFASSMPLMDPEVAKEALKQFPSFVTYGNEVVTGLRQSLDQTIADGRKGADNVYDINNRILDSLEKQLNKPFLFPGERQKIIDSMLEVSNNIAEAENSQRNFVKSALQTVAGVAVGTVVIGAAILGVDFKPGGKG